MKQVFDGGVEALIDAGARVRLNKIGKGYSKGDLGITSALEDFARPRKSMSMPLITIDGSRGFDYGSEGCVRITPGACLNTNELCTVEDSISEGTRPLLGQS